ncbi:MAG: hypothetical protein A3A86_02170 [Elusimicrobia bacterium RIFCSPLOWO2_01_FULL_60_11]|nr:MAG: hypothetical protein A3A86_02170 [Elusimicrobia bacterium RIFCSPLOWO2_01_FULL_60_11]
MRPPAGGGKKDVVPLSDGSEPKDAGRSYIATTGDSRPAHEVEQIRKDAASLVGDLRSVESELKGVASFIAGKQSDAKLFEKEMHDWRTGAGGGYVSSLIGAGAAYTVEMAARDLAAVEAAIGSGPVYDPGAALEALGGIEDGIAREIRFLSEGYGPLRAEFEHDKHMAPIVQTLAPEDVIGILDKLRRTDVMIKRVIAKLGELRPPPAGGELTKAKTKEAASFIVFVIGAVFLFSLSDLVFTPNGSFEDQSPFLAVASLIWLALPKLFPRVSSFISDPFAVHFLSSWLGWEYFGKSNIRAMAKAKMEGRMVDYERMRAAFMLEHGHLPGAKAALKKATNDFVRLFRLAKRVRALPQEQQYSLDDKIELLGEIYDFDYYENDIVFTSDISDAELNDWDRITRDLNGMFKEVSPYLDVKSITGYEWNDLNFEEKIRFILSAHERERRLERVVDAAIRGLQAGFIKRLAVSSSLFVSSTLAIIIAETFFPSSSAYVHYAEFSTIVGSAVLGQNATGYLFGSAAHAWFNLTHKLKLTAGDRPGAPERRFTPGQEIERAMEVGDWPDAAKNIQTLRGKLISTLLRDKYQPLITRFNIDEPKTKLRDEQTNTAIKAGLSGARNALENGDFNLALALLDAFKAPYYALLVREEKNGFDRIFAQATAIKAKAPVAPAEGGIGSEQGFITAGQAVVLFLGSLALTAPIIFGTDWISSTTPERIRDILLVSLSSALGIVIVRMAQAVMILALDEERTVAAYIRVGDRPLPPPSVKSKFSLIREATVSAAVSVVEKGFRGSVDEKLFRTYKDKSNKEASSQASSKISAIKDEADGLAFTAILKVFDKFKAGVWIFNSEGKGRDEVERAFVGGNYSGVQGWKKIFARLLRFIGLSGLFGIHAAVMSLDVIEGTTAFVRNVPVFSGGSSVGVSGPGVESLGQSPDIYADLVIARVPQSKINEFQDKPLDPAESVLVNLSRIAVANGKDFNGLEVVLLGRKRERARLEKMLPNVSKADIDRAVSADETGEMIVLEDPVTHLMVRVIPDGTLLVALKAGLGIPLTEATRVRLPVFYGSGGSPESMMNLAELAGFAHEGAVAGLRLMSKKVKDTENKLGAYDFTTDEINGKDDQPGLKTIRTSDWKQVVKGERLFTFADVKGDVDASKTFLTDNPAWNQRGVDEKTGEVVTLRIKSVNGKSHVWLEKSVEPMKAPPSPSLEQTPGVVKSGPDPILSSSKMLEQNDRDDKAIRAAADASVARGIEYAKQDAAQRELETAHNEWIFAKARTLTAVNRDPEAVAKLHTDEAAALARLQDAEISSSIPFSGRLKDIFMIFAGVTLLSAASAMAWQGPGVSLPVVSDGLVLAGALVFISAAAALFGAAKSNYVKFLFAGVIYPSRRETARDIVIAHFRGIESRNVMNSKIVTDNAEYWRRVFIDSGNRMFYRPARPLLRAILGRVEPRYRQGILRTPAEYAREAIVLAQQAPARGRSPFGPVKSAPRLIAALLAFLSIPVPASSQVILSPIPPAPTDRLAPLYSTPVTAIPESEIRDMMRQLDDPDPQVRILAIRALYQGGARSGTMLNKISRMVTRDPDPGVRSVALSVMDFMALYERIGLRVAPPWQRIAMLGAAGYRYYKEPAAGGYIPVHEGIHQLVARAVGARVKDFTITPPLSYSDAPRWDSKRGHYVFRGVALNNYVSAVLLGSAGIGSMAGMNLQDHPKDMYWARRLAISASPLIVDTVVQRYVLTRDPENGMYKLIIGQQVKNSLSSVILAPFGYGDGQSIARSIVPGENATGGRKVAQRVVGTLVTGSIFAAQTKVIRDRGLKMELRFTLPLLIAGLLDLGLHVLLSTASGGAATAALPVFSSIILLNPGLSGKVRARLSGSAGKASKPDEAATRAKKVARSLVGAIKLMQGGKEVPVQFLTEILGDDGFIDVEALEPASAQPFNPLFKAFEIIGREEMEKALTEAFRESDIRLSRNEVEKTVAELMSGTFSYDRFESVLKNENSRMGAAPFVAIKISAREDVRKAVQKAAAVLAANDGAKIVLIVDSPRQKSTLEGLSEFGALTNASVVVGGFGSLPQTLKSLKGPYSSKALIVPKSSLLDIMNIIDALSEDDYLSDFNIMIVDFANDALNATPFFNLKYFKEMKQAMDVIARSA